MKKSIFLIAALVLGVVFIQSCKKTEASDADVTTTEDLAMNNEVSEAIDISADIAIEERGGGGSCPTVTLDQPWGTWPNTLTIDYGPDGCTGPNGQHELKGKIVVTQTAEWYTPGATRTLNFDQFFIDDIGVEGTKTWTNNGLDANGKWSFTKTATNMALNYPDGTSTTWNHTHTVTWVEGANTPLLWLDDVWSVTGNSSGVNRNGVAFTAVISKPLIKKALCKWISEGTIDISNGVKSISLDYGNGDCDRFATLTLPNGDEVTIKLHQ